MKLARTIRLKWIFLKLKNDTLNKVDIENSKKIDNFISQISLAIEEPSESANQLSLSAVHPLYIDNQTSPQQESVIQSIRKNPLPSSEPIEGMQTSLKALAHASNITLEALETAILLRQQQLLQKQQGPYATTSTSTTTTTTTTTSTTTQAPRK